MTFPIFVDDSTNARAVYNIDPATGQPVGSGGNSMTVQGAGASAAPTTGNPVLVAGSDGTNTRTLATSASGVLQVVGNSSAGLQVAGGAAHDAVDTGNPVKIGGFASSTAPAAVSADGDRVNAAYSLKGFAYTTDKGGESMATGQVAVTTSATLVVAARTGRQKVTLSSTTAVVFYVGNIGVTSATGLYVAAAAGASITLDTAAAVYAVGASAVTISYIEFY